jgi:hypothetical protein
LCMPCPLWPVEGCHRSEPMSPNAANPPLSRSSCPEQTHGFKSQHREGQ